MAVTGLGLIGFLAAHLLGNLYVFQGREALNAYAAWLKDNPLLWPARIGLLGSFVLHTWLGISLARENRRARPERYAAGLREPLRVRLLSRRMALTGLVILAFVVFHLLHFTLGEVAIDPAIHARKDDFGRHDVYGMVVASFRNPWIVGSYVIAMGLLGLHLAHAGQSFLQTLGIRYAYANLLLKRAGLSLVTAIVLGNVTVPVLVYLGFAGPGAIPTRSADEVGSEAPTRLSQSDAAGPSAALSLAPVNGGLR
jgi:succinate dehydrogenase / fumarate reductase cytochrome b subunit